MPADRPVDQVKKQRLELRDSTRAWNSVLVPFRRVFRGRQSSDGTDNFRLSPAVNAVTLSVSAVGIEIVCCFI
jgi:hypothetical protein